MDDEIQSEATASAAPTAAPEPASFEPAIGWEPPASSTPPLPGAPRTELVVLGVALALGILADLLGTEYPYGIGLTISLVAVLGAVAWLDGRFELSLGGDRLLRRMVIGAMALLSIGMTVHASEKLAGVNVAAMVAALALLLSRIDGRPLRKLRAVELLTNAIEVPVTSTLRAGGAISRCLRRTDDEESEEPAGFVRRHARDIAIGTLVALPIVGVFTALLASADDGFADVLASIFDWNMETLLEHALGVIGLSFAALVALIALLAAPTSKPHEASSSAWAGPAVVWIVLGSTAMLFGAFLTLQGRYLFGGAEYLKERAGLSAAEYARQGFFELLVVAALVVPLLLAVRHWHSTSRGSELAFRIMAPLVAVLTVALQVSAFTRLWLYQDRYGLTDQRIYAAAILIWVAVILVWISARAIASRDLDVSAFGICTGVLVVLLLNVASPERIAAQATVDSTSTRDADAYYLASLSTDATPTLVRALDEFPRRDQKIIAQGILRHDDEADNDWRSWNWSRHRAATVVDDHRDELERAAK